jgi:hypothetical protein
MRAYKFLDKRFGLKSLYERRLKQSRIDDLNDPFELMPYHVTDLAVRMTFRQTQEDIKGRGMICFSADWCDPVIWAHYSDKHRGLSLGFEIPDMEGDPAKDEIGRVEYIPKLLPFPDNFFDLSDGEHTAFSRKVLFTKFINWAYEKEIRFFAPLQNEEDGLHFLKFDEKRLRLVEVIIGARCTLKRAAIISALGTLANKVKVIKARAAYDGFRMIEDDHAT